MSTAQRLREAAVSFPARYLSDVDSQILWVHFIETQIPWHALPGEGNVTYRTFMLIVACSLDGGEA